MKYFLAVDIGASGGRHIIGYREDGVIKTDEVYRFENGVDYVDGVPVWDVERLFSEIKNGLKECFKRYPKIESMSIDTFGVDYVLLKGESEVLPVRAYRGGAPEEIINEVHSIIPLEKLYNITGIQFATFNSIYRLYEDTKCGKMEGVTDFLLMPEYFMYKLTGVKKKEYTDNTTTSLVNAESREFDKYIWEKLGLPEVLRAPLYMPGTALGSLLPEISKEVGGDLTVVLCPTHDTAAAVEAIEMDVNSPYISSGTWSLLGIKTDKARCDIESLKSEYSNEGGVGYNRYQKNIMGLWIVQSLRKELLPDVSYGKIAEDSRKSDYMEYINVNDQSFLAPKSMKEAIDSYLTKNGSPLPKSAIDYFNCAYRSLAKEYKNSLDELERVLGVTFPSLYIVGGGAKNTYLNELTEQHTGKRVIALPIEATSIGNILTQMKRAGE